MGSLRQRRVLSSITVKRRKSWLLAASALASSSLGISGPALAANECGPVDASGSVTCLSGPSMPFPSRRSPIPPASPTTSPRPTPPLNVTLNSGDRRPLRRCHPPGPGNRRSAKQLRRRRGRPVLLSANGATINVTNPAAGDHRGLYVETEVNNATITASGQIDVAGVAGSHAIKAFVNGHVGPGDASVTYTGAGLTPFDLRSSGTNSTVIQAESLNGNAHIDASGNMSSSGNSNDFFFGLFAQTGATSHQPVPSQATHL